MLRLAGSVSVGTTSDLDYHIRNSREDDHDDDDDKHAVRGSAEGKERERESKKTNKHKHNRTKQTALIGSADVTQPCKTLHCAIL